MSEDKTPFSVAMAEAGVVFRTAAKNKEVMERVPLIDSFDLQNMTGVRSLGVRLLFPGIAPDSLIFYPRLLMASVIGSDYRAKRLDSLVSVKHPFVKEDELRGKVEMVMTLPDAIKVVKVCAESLEIPKTLLARSLARFILGNPRAFVGGNNISRVSVAPDIVAGLLN